MAHERIGSYRVLDRLGGGGMGVVYRAEHVAMGQRAVVKKLWPQYGQNPQVVARFFQEAKIAAGIDDPGIVRIFDYGTLGDGSSYIVMEQLNGETLAERLRREGALHVDLAVALARQAARIVGAAHARGVVHRDLKPENLFLVVDPEVVVGVRVKVLDFGIAKLIDGIGADLTSSGAVLGTPPYMPPEQWRNAAAVDRRADVYALGCILFEMLCGKRPFPGPGQLEYLDQHRFQKPAAPGSLVAGIPPELDEVVLRALAKPAEDRFASMDELAKALSRVPWTGSRPSLAPPRSSNEEPARSDPHLTPEPASAPGRPRARGGRALRWTAIAGAGLGIAAAASFGGAAYVERTGAEGRRRAIAARLLSEADSAFAAHDYVRAVEAYDAARASGAVTPRRARAELEATAQRAHEELDKAMGRKDFDEARLILEANRARSGLYWAAKVDDRASTVNARYVDAHASAAHGQVADSAACEREARLALAVDPASDEANAALAACARSAAPPPRPSRDDEARRLLDEGNSLVTQAKDYDGAEAKYLAVLELKPGRTYAAWAYRGLGTACTYAGKSKEAARWFRLYLPLVQDEPTRTQVRTLIDRLDR